MEQGEPKKVYTKDEIAVLSPRYRGKPENFNPSKKRPPGPIVRKRDALKTKIGPTSANVVPGTEVNSPQKPTPQRNDSIIAESIFGVDVSVVPIQPRQNFQTNLAKLDLAIETYASYIPDVKQLDRKLAKDELSYYLTGLMWLKLIDVKAKQGRSALTREEKELRKATNEVEFNVPQPIHAFLTQIGNVTDKMGKETELEVPALPTSVAQGHGGYHAPEITSYNHNLFEEIPSLGVTGDMVLLLTAEAQEPELNVRVARPEHTVFNENLVGVNQPLGPRRPEIVQRLAGQGITVDHFPEFIEGTRFNLRYMLSISDIISQFETFRIEKVNFSKLTMSGGISQVILTKPLVTEGMQQMWRKTIVQATSAANESVAEMGASFIFGFQLYKEPGEGATLAQRSRGWSCIHSSPEGAWTMPLEWVENRNIRRNLPEGIGTERFRAMSKYHDKSLQDVVRRMIKTQR